MNWIDMSDRDKLFNYARAFKSTKFRILHSADEDVSYFTNCKDSQNEPDITVYDVERYDQIKKQLMDMWSQSMLQQADLLTTIVSATALKNIPKITDKKLIAIKNGAKGERIKKESYESINSEDGPPVFIYEF